MIYTETLTILIFLILIYGLGKLFCSRTFNFLETITLGLASIPIIGIILNILHIPLDWRIFLGIALIAPCHQFLTWRRAGGKLPQIKLKKPSCSWQTLLVLAVFIFTLAIYCWGPFQYDWLENDDPWAHAAGIKYIAIEKNLNAPEGTFQYLNPYPPGYDLLFGVLHQTSPSIYWTMKFFNGLIICLGFLFFYMLITELSGSKSKAALATFFLALIPCYLTHFIWAHSLAITLGFPAFYFLIKSFKEKKYIVPASLCWAALTLVQPTQPIKFAVMAILLVIAFLPTKIKWKNLSIIVLISSTIALLWWGPIILKSISGKSVMALRNETKITGEMVSTAMTMKDVFAPSSGSATQAYSWKHFVFISDPNLINNPVGLSLMITILAMIGLLCVLLKLNRKKDDGHKPYYLTILLWLIFTFLGINSMTFNLPIGLFAFRFWMLFAIPIVLLCTEALFTLENFCHLKWNKIIIVGLFIITIIRTTLPFKWYFNTNEWSFGVHWTSREDINGYVWLRQKLPINTKVFSFTDNALVIGHDMHADFWTDDYKKRFTHVFEKNTDILYKNLSEAGYDCLIINPRDILKYSMEEVNAKIKSLHYDPRFRLLFNNKAVKIFQIIR